MKTIYLTPHTHYDVVWAFTKEDYLQIHELILRKAVEMIRNCGYKFLVEQAFLLEQIEQRDPELFSAIRETIAQGKIEIVDGQYIMADPMIPDGEVLVREIMTGKRYIKEKFGVDVPVAWASDGFGLNAQLPQIYKKCGYRWLAFRRGLPSTIGYRVSEFLWEGLDGTQILSHWMPFGYRAGMDLEKWEETFSKLSALATTDNILMPCGSGGVPPQDRTPDKVDEWNQNHENSRMVIATPREFFESFERDRNTLTTYRGELYSPDLENIFPDVVSTRTSLKVAIKESENALLMAERLAAVARLQGEPYPAERMQSMWKKMLFLAHHDVMPSCGIDEIYEEAWEYIADLKKDSQELTAQAVCSLAQVKKDAGGAGIIVANPNDWEVTSWVEADVELDEGCSEEPGLRFRDQEIPCEILNLDRRKDGALRRCRLGFVATVPPTGYRVFRLAEKKEPRQNRVEFRDRRVMTPYFDLEVNPENGILRVWNKEGRQILQGNEIVIDEEIGDLYFHHSRLDRPIGSESGGGIRFAAFKPEEFKIEQGPVRTVITFKDAFYCLRWPYYLTEYFGPQIYRHKTVDITKQVIVYENLPRIDFVTTLHLQQSHVRIRLKFDTCMVAPKYTRQTQFGVIDLPHSRTLAEGVKAPSLSWVNGEEGDRGLAFLSCGVPINDIHAGDIYYTLLRSVSVLSADGSSGPLVPTPGAQELGKHTYAYSVYPHDGDWKKAGIHRRASEFNHRLFAFQMDGEAAEDELGTLTLEPPNLIISSLKKAEADDSVILRFYETHGKACRTVLTLPPQVKGVLSTNLIEQEERKAPIRDGKLEIDVGPFEIVTLKLLLEE